MVNPQRSGLRSDTWLCSWCLHELERSVLFIFRPTTRGQSDGGILLEVRLGDNGILLGKRN